jgi:hypothetical protein
MIKLIKEFLRSGIEANQATAEAMKASAKSSNRAIEYYDTIIYYDSLIKSLQVQNEKTSEPPHETVLPKLSQVMHTKDEGLEEYHNINGNA